MAASYQSVADKLKARILNGAWTPGTTLPSYRTLARELNVGEKTAWLALNQLKADGLIRPAANRRLIVAPATFELATNRNMLLCVCPSGLLALAETGYRLEIMRGIFRGADRLKVPLKIVHGNKFTWSMPSDVDPLSLKGVLILGALLNEAMNRYVRLPVPIVFVDTPLYHPDAHQVCVDNHAAFKEAARRLVAFGHRRIGFLRRVSWIRKRVDPDSEERESGLRAGLTEAGLKERALVVNTIMGENNAHSPSIQSMFTKRPLPTAIVTVDPELGMMAVQAAKERGLAIPKDLSVVSFQPGFFPDLDLSGPVGSFEEIGHRSVNLLAEPKTPPQHTQVRSKWKAGATLGPAPGSG